jgi:hypothetical protein
MILRLALILILNKLAWGCERPLPFRGVCDLSRQLSAMMTLHLRASTHVCMQVMCMLGVSIQCNQGMAHFYSNKKNSAAVYVCVLFLWCLHITTTDRQTDTDTYAYSTRATHPHNASKSDQKHNTTMSPVREPYMHVHIIKNEPLVAHTHAHTHTSSHTTKNGGRTLACIWLAWDWRTNIPHHHHTHTHTHTHTQTYILFLSLSRRNQSWLHNTPLAGLRLMLMDKPLAPHTYTHTHIHTHTNIHTLPLSLATS